MSTSDSILLETAATASASSTRQSPERNIAARIDRARVAITNAANPDLVNALTSFGYDTAKLAQGQALLSAVLAAQNTQINRYASQRTATDAVTDSRKALEELYVPHLKIARVALKGDRGAGQALGLEGKRYADFPRFVAQARLFYEGLAASPAYAAALAVYGQTDAQLQAGRAAVAAVETAHAAQKMGVGSAQNATKVRNAALKKLENWLADFLEIARVALRDQPQRLESLGVFVRS